MKKLLAFAVLFSLAACFGPVEEPVASTNYRPILMLRSDLEKSIEVKAPTPIKNAGKIYVYKNLLFINERFNGIHIFNNIDPTNPTDIGYINIPGNIDISIVDDVIYADNSVDLVALEFDGQKVTELSRQRNVFPEVVAPDFGAIPDQYLPQNRPENTVIIRWEQIN